MTRFSIALLLSTTMLGSAFADEFKFASNVDAVTVFPSGAEVERIASGKLEQGTHTVIIENLPADISPDSVRVEGLADGGVSIGSVDVKQVYISRNLNSEERLKLERQVETLNDEFMRLEQVVADTGLQRKMLENLISNAGKPGKDEASNALSALEVADLLDGASTRLDAYAQRSIDARASQRDVQRQMQDLQGKIAQLAPVEELRSVVAINLNVAAPSDATFKVKYAVQQAGWEAIYDASLKLGDSATGQSVDIVRRANVIQSTSESWDGVALSLSTARPSTSTAAPELFTYEINQQHAMPRGVAKMRSVGKSLESEMLSESADYAAAPAPLQPVAVEQVAMDVGGFQATYAIPGKVTITNTGETKSVTMGQESFPVELSAYTVPLLDPAAYLIGTFELVGDATYLPGTVLLSRDGAYIGRGAMPMLSPGESHDLSFGRDDFITVERVETDRKEGETGIISTSLTDEQKSVTTIKNLHNFDMKVKVVDRLPVSNHEDITVEMLSASTKPTVKDVDGKRGILNWDMVIEGGQSAVIDFGYRVTWPKEMRISALQ